MKKQTEGIKLFSLPFSPGVEAISGRHILNEFRRHIHKTYIVGMVEQGKRIIDHLDGSTQVSENEIFIINPGQVHSCSSKDQSGHSYKLLSIESQTIQSIASQISEKPEKRPYFKEIHYDNNELSEKFMRLFDMIKEPESDIEIESNIHAFIAYLVMFFSDYPPLIYMAGEQKDSVKRVCDYIGQNFTENLSLKKLAGIACLSPFHFQREFKKYMGITPHEYLSDFRISESKKILLKSEDIADISVQLGFFFFFYFSRIFRKAVGVSPGKYTKTNRMR